jgi:hypothetical protein
MALVRRSDLNRPLTHGEVDDNFTYLEGLSGGSTTPTQVTITEVNTLILTSTLIPGTLYEISGVHPTLYDDGTTSGTTIFLTALTNNKLTIDGQGIFYNPKYTTTPTQNIWENAWILSVNNIVGIFEPNEPITANNGAVGVLVVSINSGYVFVTNPTGWGIGVTSLTGDNSGATADVLNTEARSTFDIGDKRIWGGYVWENVTGLNGSPIDDLNLDNNWSKVAYNEVDYNKVLDIIKYDINNDFIFHREDNEYNVVSLSTYNNIGTSISLFQWGNSVNFGTLQGTGYNIIETSIIQNINNCVLFYGNTLICGSSLSNIISINNGVLCGLITSYLNSSSITDTILLGYIGSLDFTNSSLSTSSISSDSKITRISASVNTNLSNIILISNSYLDSSNLSGCTYTNLTLINNSQIYNINVNNGRIIDIELNLSYIRYCMISGVGGIESYRGENNSYILDCIFIGRTIFDSTLYNNKQLRSIHFNGLYPMAIPDISTATIIYQQTNSLEVVRNFNSNTTVLKYLDGSNTEIIVSVTT